jgi:hypothetical protein
MLGRVCALDFGDRDSGGLAHLMTPRHARSLDIPNVYRASEDVPSSGIEHGRLRLATRGFNLEICRTPRGGCYLVVSIH